MITLPDFYVSPSLRAIICSITDIGSVPVKFGEAKEAGKSNYGMGLHFAETLSKKISLLLIKQYSISLEIYLLNPKQIQNIYIHIPVVHAKAYK